MPNEQMLITEPTAVPLFFGGMGTKEVDHRVGNCHHSVGSRVKSVEGIVQSTAGIKVNNAAPV